MLLLELIIIVDAFIVPNFVQCTGALKDNLSEIYNVRLSLEYILLSFYSVFDMHNR